MAVCNIFKSLKINEGIFLSFSQYMEDLTTYMSKGYNYRLVPSKFIAMNINVKDGEFDNSTLPKFIQNYFENGCAIWKNEEDWQPTYSKDLFWWSLISSDDKIGLLSIDKDNICDSIKYIGDINITSYDEVDGMGYSEIYCYIPNDAEQKLYRFNIENYKKDGEYIEPLKKSDKSYIEGYDENDLGDWGRLDEGMQYPLKNYTIEELNTTQNPSFDINSIVILYNIYNNDTNEPLYSDIPMGIYFTGSIDQTNGIITNSITKYVSNDSIYGLGSSYGLRICTRFALTNGDVEISVNNNEYHSDITLLLSEMSKTQSKMDEIISNTYNDSQNYKDLLAIFKNTRTNVPYIKNINGVNYWFVNGRMINKASIDNNIGEGYDLSVTIKDNIILLTDTPTSGKGFDRYMNWSIKSGDVDIKPSSLYVNGEPQSTLQHDIQIHVDKYDDQLIKEYIVEAIPSIDSNIKITESAHISFVWPSYFGLMDKELNDIKQQLSVERLDSRRFSKCYTNTDYKHIYYAYPQSFGKLISITDSRDIEYINDFECIETQINFDGKLVDYFIYKDIHPANVINYTLKFK